MAKVAENGVILCWLKDGALPSEWAHALAHCALHLALGHFVKKENQALWNIACDCVVEKFLAEMRFAGCEMADAMPSGIGSEDKLYERFLLSGVPPEYAKFGTAAGTQDMLFDWHEVANPHAPDSWAALFADGLRIEVQHAVRRAGAAPWHGSSRYSEEKNWFVSNYPLLGAIAADFKIVVETDVCERMDVQIAAVSCTLGEIYINPGARLSEEELRFVIAHELLHAALRHDVRHEWRDPFLWNVACDFIINGWLAEMGIGERPDSALYDERFKSHSAEQVYDVILDDMKGYRKLATLRGAGLGDILPGDIGKAEDGVDLDAFYRRALAQGLEYHQGQGRGYLPAGLIEEIRALSHPPIPWDVALARWFDALFEPLERRRSYARQSRRQSSTPDIPRPSWVHRTKPEDGRTFGVLLDTSCSMKRSALASALGAIASYSAARDVPGVRVVFCDANAYDQGYMKPEDVVGTVQVVGRGGTVLQAGIEILRSAEDFPKNAPLLIITDGECDRLTLYGREHAFLMPAGKRLPFTPKGQVFLME